MSTHNTVIPGKSIMIAHLYPQKMIKQMLRRFMIEQHIFQDLHAKYFDHTHLDGLFAVEDIYDSFSPENTQENVERLMLHLVADKDISADNLKKYKQEAINSLKNMTDELTKILPDSFNKTIYKELIHKYMH